MAEMYVRKMMITPDIAKSYLETNQRNRKIRQNKVTAIENAIRKGDFVCTHQCIAIDENGKLVDGHHRLNAIVNTGIPVEVMVMFNAPESEKIDIGTSRNDKDSLFMAGIIEKDSIEYCPITYPLISFTVTRMFGQSAANNMTSIEKHESYMFIKDIVDPIITIGKTSYHNYKRSMASSIILYSMMCAYQNGISINILKDWHYIVSTGDFYCENDEEKTKAGRCLLLFSKYMNERKKLSSHNSKEEVEDAIKKAESSIRHFANKTVVTKLYGEKCFPEIEPTEEMIKYFLERR